MACIELDKLSFHYPEEEQAAIRSISLTVDKGDFIVIGGPSGCGKTTLLKLLKKELTPVGRMTGQIRMSDMGVGFVFQDPENQIVMDNVLSELVFGMENEQLGTGEMRQRVAEMVHFFGMEDLLDQDTRHLSGGQKQLMNVASVLLQKPDLLLLDEPTSQLDPVQAKALIQFVHRLNEEFGMTIIMVEHRLEELYPIADRVILMEKGSVAYEGTARTVVSTVWKNQDNKFLPFLPAIAKLYYTFADLSYDTRVPLSVKEAQRWLSDLSIGMVEHKREVSSEQALPLLEMNHVSFKYEKRAPMILKDISLEVRKGDFLTVVGGNASGKTTLLKIIASILKPYSGKVRLNGKQVSKKSSCRMGYLPQNPLLCFMCETLQEEILELAVRYDIPLPEERMRSIANRLGIESILEKHTHDCSGGEQQKAALATLLFIEPDLLLIDEPTKGMDAVSKDQFSVMLDDLHQDGMTILMVTHDIEFAARHASRCAWLFDGRITADGTVREVLDHHYFYTTTINRVSQNADVPTVLTVEEAYKTWNLHVPS